MMICQSCGKEIPDAKPNDLQICEECLIDRINKIRGGTSGIIKLKQFNLGPLFGAIRFHAAGGQFYVYVVSQMMLGAAAIRTVQEWFPWVTYPLLMLGVVVIGLLGILVEHLFVYKSVLTYTTRQAFIPENPAAEYLIKIDQRLESLEKRIENLTGH